ncbi:Anaphase-promoting complex subunit 2-like protein [Drosera capensis]
MELELQNLDADSMSQILDSWSIFCSHTESLLAGGGDGGGDLFTEFEESVQSLCKHGIKLLVRDHFLSSLEVHFEREGASRFWERFSAYAGLKLGVCNEENGLVEVLRDALEHITLEKQHQQRCLLMLIRALESYWDSSQEHESDAERTYILSKYQLLVSSVLIASLPRHFPEVLHWYFKGRLEELSTLMDGDYASSSASQDADAMDLDGKCKPLCSGVDMDIDESYYQSKITEKSRLVNDIGKVVQDLRDLGFTSMTEDAYASALFLLLKAKVHHLAGDDYRSSVLESIKGLCLSVSCTRSLIILETAASDSLKSGLRSPLVSPLNSLYPGIDTPSESLIRWKLRLELVAYETLQDIRIAKLFEIIVDYPDSIVYCASTNDILHQYVSTIKALRTIDPVGVFLEAVGEPIREYLKGRKDTVKCIVTMLTDSSAGNATASSVGDSLLEEINREEEGQDTVGPDDEYNIDDKQAWINAQRWEPDPVQADPMKGSRNRWKVDILGMLIGLIGSKDQLVNEFRVMLAEKLLNKSDYDIDAEIRQVELLKKCEIMLNDLIGSKRTNGTIKATLPKPSETSAMEESDLLLDCLGATIISSNFWPPIQDENLKVPEPVDQLLSDYANRFHDIKTPRKLLWKKSLGVVKNLAAAIGVPVDLLNRRINFWLSKGILAESSGGDSENRCFTLVESIAGSNGGDARVGGTDELLMGDEDAQSSVASVEDQLRKEMTIYEMFCVADPPYFKSLQQLQSFMSGLVSEEKLEMKDGMYVLKK